MPISLRVASALVALCGLIPALGCGGGAPSSEAPSPACPDCIWNDATAALGVAYTHVEARGGVTDYLPQTMGPGVAAADLDGDGRADLFFPPGAGDEAAGKKEPAAHWYRRDATGTKFEEVAAQAGLAARGSGQAVLATDFDNDGYTDLVVTRYWDANLLYRNNGDGTFTEEAAARGAQGLRKYTSFATAIDRDRDGVNDLYIGNYLDFKPESWVKDPPWTTRDQGKFLDTLLPGPYAPERNLLLANHGGRFTDVTAAAGALDTTGKSLGALTADLDDDGWLDLFVANDVSPCALLHNKKGGVFADIAQAAFVGETRGSMGLWLHDLENDLKADVAVSHWVGDIPALYQRISRPGRPPAYADRARTTALASYPVELSGWAIAFLDLENDGNEALFVLNGHTNPPPGQKGKLVGQAPMLLPVTNGKLAFRAPGPPGDLFGKALVGRGAAFTDLDHDGTIDIAISCNNEPASVWLHRPAAGAWLEVAPTGAASNRDAIGTRVELLEAGAVKRVKQVVAGDSYFSSRPYRVHFGLGAAEAPVTLRLSWPSGRIEEFAGLAVRRMHRLVEGAGRTVRAPAG